MLSGTIPWAFVILGVMIGVTVELLGISSLPFAIGLYLPISLSLPIMIGALVYVVVTRTASGIRVKEREDRGILFASGLVAGDALVGIIVAVLISTIPSFKVIYDRWAEAGWLGSLGAVVSLTVFLVLAVALGMAATRIGKNPHAESR